MRYIIKHSEVNRIWEIFDTQNIPEGMASLRILWLKESDVDKYIDVLIELKSLL